MGTTGAASRVRLVVEESSWTSCVGRDRDCLFSTAVREASWLYELGGKNGIAMANFEQINSVR